MKKLLIPILLLKVLALSAAAGEEDLFRELENHYRAESYLLVLDSSQEFLSLYPLSDLVPEAQYLRGLSLFRLQRYSEALQVFKEIEKRQRGARFFITLYFWQGACFYQLKEFSQCAAALEAFLNRAVVPGAGEQNAGLVPQALLTKGLAEIALEDFQSASVSLERLNGQYPSSPSAPQGLVLLVYVYQRQGRNGEVLAITEKADSAALPARWQSQLKLYRAEALRAEGRPEEAERLYTQLLEAEPELAAVALRRLFSWAQAQGDLGRMEDLLLLAEQRFSASPLLLADFWARTGIESYKRDELAQAEFLLAKAWSRLEKKDTVLGQSGQAVALYLAEVLIREGELARAASVLEELLALQKSGPALMRLGDIRLLQGDVAAAKTLYRRYLEGFTGSERFLEAGYLEAYCLYRLGATEEALDLASMLLKESSQKRFRQELLRLQGILQQKLGRLAEAARGLKEYAASYPQDLKARVDLLKLLFRLQRFQQVLEETAGLDRDFPRLEEKDPRAHFLAWYLRGLAQISLKDYPAAVQTLAALGGERAREAGLAPLVPYRLYYLGWARYRGGDYREARAEMQGLLEGFPGHPLYPQALYLAGWCSYSLRQYAEAAAAFSQLAKIDPGLSARASFLQGKSLRNLGRTEEALAVFQGLLQSQPDSLLAADSLFESSELLALLGRAGEAAEGFELLVRRYPQSPLREEALYKRGEVFWNSAAFPKAKDAYVEYRRAFSKGRLVDAALYWGGMAAFQLGEKFEAVMLWEELGDQFHDSPFRPDALKRAAELYAERGDYRRALDIFAALTGEYAEEARAAGVPRRMEEIRYLLQGLTDREASLAAAVGREGGAQTAGGRRAMIELSRLYIYEGGSRSELALPMLSQVAGKEDPAAASQAQYLIGEYYYRKSDPLLAASEFLKAATLNPKDPDLMAASIYRAAEMMKLAGKSLDARELVRRLEDNFPGSQWTLEGGKLLEESR